MLSLFFLKKLMYLYGKLGERGERGSAVCERRNKSSDIGVLSSKLGVSCYIKIETDTMLNYGNEKLCVRVLPFLMRQKKRGEFIYNNFLEISPPSSPSPPPPSLSLSLWRAVHFEFKLSRKQYKKKQGRERERERERETETNDFVPYDLLTLFSLSSLSSLLSSLLL